MLPRRRAPCLCWAVAQRAQQISPELAFDCFAILQELAEMSHTTKSRVALEAGCESLALLWFLGFVCLLRTPEMTGLKRCHILLHDHFAVSVITQFSKTSRGNAQVVSFCDQNLFSLAQSVKQAGSSQSLIWPHSVQCFRSVLQGCLRYAKLAKTSFDRLRQ